MKKHLRMIAFCCFAGLLFTSCDNSGKKIIGTWVQPKEESSFVDEQGFTLLDDGEVISINSGNYNYQSWEKQGDKLLIKGAYTGTNPHEFCDTMNIKEVTDEHLILEQGGYEVTYIRK